MWQVELLHPALVHFPIALLTVGIFFELASIAFRTPERRWFLRDSSLLLLILGTLGAWLAVWSGEQAYSIVNWVTCDPTSTDRHEEWGEIAAWSFSGVSLLSLIRWWMKKQQGEMKLVSLEILSAVVCVGGGLGVALIAYTAYLGEMLVYQPGADCSCSARASATRCPSSAADTIPPANPPPSPAGYSP